MQKKLSTRILNVFPYVLIFCAILGNIYVMLKYGRQNLSSDMSSEMVLANLMNEHHDFLFCSDWVYSTEIRVIYLQAAFRLGLLLFPNNWYYARIFGTVVVQIVLVVSFLHLCKSLGIYKYGKWIAAISIFPLGTIYFNMSTWGGFYIPHMILYIVLTDLLIIYSKKESKIILFLTILLSFLGGLAGVRIAYNYALPLFTISLISAFIRTDNKRLTNIIKNYVSKYRIVLIELIFIALGLLVYLLYLRNNYYLGRDAADTILYMPTLDKLTNTIVYFCWLLGWDSLGSIISKENVLSIFGIVIPSMMFVCFIWSIKNIKSIIKENIYKSMFIYSIPIALLEVALVLNITSRNQPRFLIPLIPFCLIYIAMCINEIKLNENIKNVLILLIIISSILVSYNTVYSFKNKNKNNDREKVVSYLLENNLIEGYSSYADADGDSHNLTELSNGKIKMWVHGYPFEEESTFEYIPWLQTVDSLTNDPTADKVFLLISPVDEIDTSAISDYETFALDEYQIFVFDDFDKIRNFMNNRSVE